MVREQRQVGAWKTPVCYLRKRIFNHRSDQILEEVAQRGCSLFNLENIQELTGMPLITSM